FTIEMWVRPGTLRDAGTILAFYQAESAWQFAVRQSGNDLELSYEPRDGRLLAKPQRTYSDDVLHEDVPTFITITSGGAGTAVYRDGALVKNVSLRLPAAAIEGNLVLFTSPIVNDNWTGSLRGLAIYGQELPAAQVLRHYQSWTKTGRPSVEGA